MELSSEADSICKHQKLFGHKCAEFTELKDAKTEIEAKSLLWNARSDAAGLLSTWERSPLSQVLHKNLAFSCIPDPETVTRLE